MKIELDREPIYSDNDKYIKAKIKSYEDKVKFSRQKNTKRKRIILVFVIDNARFGSYSK